MLITRKEFAAELAGRLEISKSEANSIIAEVIDSLKTFIKRGDDIELRGLFTTVYRERKAMQRYAPRLGKKIEIPARRVVRLKLAKMLRTI